MSGPFTIGLTGNIATGKSAVARMLVDLGAEAIDADQVAHTVMRPGTPVHAAIVERFGCQVLRDDGTIDRARLGSQVFSDPQALAHLERIVHPAVIREVERRIEAATAAVVVVEAIKLIEAGMADTCDTVWVTVCPAEERIRRLVEQRGMSRAEAQQRVAAQPPQSEKVAHADVVINTHGDLASTREQVEAAWSRLMRALELPRE
ncbi:MAG: dephospho-CoA kinase [Anaerolineae bacterium]|jgi:dephospho-CoA kinase